jgi:Holliday junction resolvase
MTTSSARKGANAELEIARLLADELGVRVRRKLGAGRSDDEGDIDGLVDTCVEVKAYTDTVRAIGDALRDLEREQRHSGQPYAVAFIKRPRLGWIAVQTVPQFCALWREATHP